MKKSKSQMRRLKIQKAPQDSHSKAGKSKEKPKAGANLVATLDRLRQGY